MAKYVIEDTTLTGIADAIRAKTGGTDPISVTDMAAQIAAITGGGSEETLTAILEEQTVAFNESGEASIEATTPLVVGETYTVVWNGTKYECEAFGFSPSEGMTIPTIGNPSAVGGEDNGLPFVGICEFDETAGLTHYVFLALDGSTSATVAIYQKTSGGGSVEGIVYVTFMNGGTELCKTACMKGDSTVDPVADGKIAVPTKEPTVDTVYTYAGGWALTDGGEADELALIDVTEDRTVYAAYTESVREYTVNFYDDDGTTLIESVQTPYGSIPSMTFVPEKEHYALTGWEPALVTVTGDANYTAVWESTLATVASGDCGDAAKWMLTEDNVLTIYGSGNMTDYSTSARPGWDGYKGSITKVIVSPGVTGIGAYAFYQHAALTDMDIANTITSIGNYAFRECTALVNVTTLPETITIMNMGCFMKCTALKKVVVPDSVTEIKSEVFSGCTVLSDVTLSENLLQMQGSVFYACAGLTKITIPASVTFIGVYSFENSGLTSAVFEDTTTWYAGSATNLQETPLSSANMANASTAATYLRSTYKNKRFSKY